jgi:SWI/SNF-related matrix-associated actin-dependent regulator of chromatin subfamily A member 5
MPCAHARASHAATDARAAGEQKIQRRAEISNYLSKKVTRTKNPWVQLRIDYGGDRPGKGYSEEIDRFLVCMTNQLGFGRWEELRSEVRQSWLFRFDWFLKTRTAQELARRVDLLAQCIEKEIQEQEAEEAAEAKRKKGKGAAPPKAGSKRPMEGGEASASKKKK